MPPTVKYHGKDTLIFWIPAVGAAIDLTGSSRSIEIDEKGNSIDVSTRDDLQANTRQKLADIPDRTWNAGGLDTTPGSSRKWRTIAVGDTGSLLMYPLGSTGSGKPVEKATAVILGRNYSSPHDNAASWKLDGELTSDIADTVTA
jgi:hypothetical protein